MLLRDVQRLTALRSMQVFLDENAEALRGFDYRGGARRAFDKVVEELASLHLTQAASDIGTRGERFNEGVLADRLRHNYFWPLTKVAKAMKPKVEVLCAITFPYRRTNTTALVQRARATVDVARPHQEALERFIGKGFLDAFLRAAAELEAALPPIPAAQVDITNALFPGDPWYEAHPTVSGPLDVFGRVSCTRTQIDALLREVRRHEGLTRAQNSHYGVQQSVLLTARVEQAVGGIVMKPNAGDLSALEQVARRFRRIFRDLVLVPARPLQRQFDSQDTPAIYATLGCSILPPS